MSLCYNFFGTPGKMTEEDEKYYNVLLKTVEPLRMPRALSKVTDHIYLGDHADSCDVEALRQHGITHVVNTVAAYVDNRPLYGDLITALSFSAEDDEGYDIAQHFEEVYQFLEKVKAANGRCLVHCMAGINRSGFLVTAYMMVSQKIGPITAAAYVHEARGILLTNRGFCLQLIQLARSRNLLSLDDHKLPQKTRKNVEPQSD